jgi:aspartyl protease family protein
MGMGLFRQRVDIGAIDAGPFAPVDAFVDTGATYSLFPRNLLTQLGAVAHDRAEFISADGRTIVRELATVVVRIGNSTRHVLCIIGDDDIDALLGATTLELFGLAADSVNQRLVPTPLYLMPHALIRPPDASRSLAGPTAG